jgi:hypothetical protein
MPPPRLSNNKQRSRGAWPIITRRQRCQRRKDYAAGSQTKTMTLDAVEFIRRFLLHVLPSGFVHIHHFGFLADRKRKDKLSLCRSLLPAPQVVIEASAGSPGSPDSSTEEQLSRRCPVCHAGRLVPIQYLTAAACACLPAPVVADTSRAP